MMALGNIVGRLEPDGKGGDKLGRWSYLTFRRAHHGPVTFVSVYQVNKLPTNKQGLTVWHQQRLALDREGHEHLHPRKAFIDHLIKQVKMWHRPDTTWSSVATSTKLLKILTLGSLDL
jgi:hypothetical protein